MIACIDVLKGFPDAIASVYPHTDIQLCIVHMVRNSLRFVSWKDCKWVTTDLKAIYQASTEDSALSALEAFVSNGMIGIQKLGSLGVPTGRIYEPFLVTLKILGEQYYTTNAIESLNSVIRHTTKKRKIFSSDDSARKVNYLAVQNAAKKWTMPIQNWKLAMNWFMIHFDERLRDQSVK